MTPDQQKNAQKFFAMLAQYGVTEALVISPPEGGDVVAKIEPTGELSMIDKRDGQRKKPKIQ